MQGMPHWWHMQYRIFVKGQRFGTAPITQPGVQRQELQKALQLLGKKHPEGSGSEGASGDNDSVRRVQHELLRANTQHFHEIRAQRAMDELLSKVSASRLKQLAAAVQSRYACACAACRTACWSN